ncbi:MAG: uncharacterized protein KVP18_000995 [Porospora cf. gigantea A]|uniref:uncharacterized protein n=2 Tax=Porospora cf. gigantea A TaxID=2853593 RepID=UPI00355A6332|nr:MAG: hypothetical protein KVP18_000995 [Porospora cf. gigantea A]
MHLTIQFLRDMRFGRRVKTGTRALARRVSGRQTANRPFWLPMELQHPNLRFETVPSPHASPLSQRDVDLDSTRDSIDKQIEILEQMTDGKVSGSTPDTDEILEQMMGGKVSASTPDTEVTGCFEHSESKSSARPPVAVSTPRCQLERCQDEREHEKALLAPKVAEGPRDLRDYLADVDWPAMACVMMGQSTAPVPIILAIFSGMLAYAALCFLWYFRYLWFLLVICAVHTKLRD